MHEFIALRAGQMQKAGALSTTAKLILRTPMDSVRPTQIAQVALQRCPTLFEQPDYTVWTSEDKLNLLILVYKVIMVDLRESLR